MLVIYFISTSFNGIFWKSPEVVVQFGTSNNNEMFSFCINLRRWSGLDTISQV